MTRSASNRKSTTPRVRAERLEARITPEQRALFQRAAELEGRTLTDFVVSSVLERAVKTIEQMEVIRLSAEESRAFADALVTPRKPSAALKAAAKRYRALTGT